MIICDFVGIFFPKLLIRAELFSNICEALKMIGHETRDEF